MNWPQFWIDLHQLIQNKWCYSVTLMYLRPSFLEMHLKFKGMLDNDYFLALYLVDLMHLALQK